MVVAIASGVQQGREKLAEHLCPPCKELRQAEITFAFLRSDTRQIQARTVRAGFTGQVADPDRMVATGRQVQAVQLEKLIGHEALADLDVVQRRQLCRVDDGVAEHTVKAEKMHQRALP